MFKQLLRDTVGPVLREHGLRGSGMTFVLPDPQYWAQFGFQKSTSSASGSVTFTVNLKVTSKAWWEEQRLEHSYLKDTPPPGVDQGTWDVERLAKSYYPIRPSALMSDQGDSSRLGELIPGVESVHWWTLRADNAPAVLNDVLDAIVAHGLPWLRRQAGMH